MLYILTSWYGVTVNVKVSHAEGQCFNTHQPKKIFTMKFNKKRKNFNYFL